MLDLRFLDFDTMLSASSQGMVPKAYDSGIFYKTNNYNPTDGFYGYFAMNDVIATRYLNQIGISCLQYDGDMAKIRFKGQEYTCFVSWSLDYRVNGEDTSFQSYLLAHGHSDIDGLDVMRSLDNDYLDCMLAADFLVGNRDRHGSNIRLSGGTFVPLFDFNGSLFLIDAEPCGHKLRANNFIGSTDLEANLRLASKLPKVSAPNYDLVFSGLNYPSIPALRTWLDERRALYEKVRNSGA